MTHLPRKLDVTEKKNGALPPPLCSWDRRLLLSMLLVVRSAVEVAQALSGLRAKKEFVSDSARFFGGEGKPGNFALYLFPCKFQLCCTVSIFLPAFAGDV